MADSRRQRVEGRSAGAGASFYEEIELRSVEEQPPHGLARRQRKPYGAKLARRDEIPAPSRG
jgi:hypothetical protein